MSLEEFLALSDTEKEQYMDAYSLAKKMKNNSDYILLYRENKSIFPAYSSFRIGAATKKIKEQTKFYEERFKPERQYLNLHSVSLEDYILCPTYKRLELMHEINMARRYSLEYPNEFNLEKELKSINVSNMSMEEKIHAEIKARDSYYKKIGGYYRPSREIVRKIAIDAISMYSEEPENYPTFDYDSAGVYRAEYFAGEWLFQTKGCINGACKYVLCSDSERELMKKEFFPKSLFEKNQAPNSTGTTFK